MGPDIILLNDLPYESYAKQGILTDLSDALMPLVKSNELFPNISTAYRQGNTIYATPLRFSFPVLWGKSDILNQVHSLHDLALYKKAHPDEPLYQYEEPDYLIRLFYPLCSPAWMNQKNEIDKASLIYF